MKQQGHIPRLSGISKEPVILKAEQPVQTLLNLFQDYPDLPVVPIAGDEGYLDCVSRKALLNLMTRPFTRDLYAKKPISCLLEILHGTSVVMEPQSDINAAAIELLALDPTLQTDAFPLVEEGGCVGVVAVSDLMLAVTEEQKSLLGELDRLSSRIREEVAMGKKVQQDLLPPTHQLLNGITVAGGICTSTEIGGDFFDYFAIGEHQVGLVIADVSGHGVQAGMVTTAAKASLHTLLALGVTTPGGLLSGMNNAILQTARQSLLMTCLIACIDTQGDTLTIANAGHNFPYLVRGSAGAPEMLDEAVGFPLGFETDCSFTEHRTPFRAGDALFLYTDGIIECVDGEGEEFGYERFSQLLQRAAYSCSPEKLHGHLLAGAGEFSGSAVFDDDVTTLYALRRG